MPNLHVLSALQDKAHELRSAIVSCEEHLERNRSELALITATLTSFYGDGGRLTDGRPAAPKNCAERACASSSRQHGDHHGRLAS